MKSFHLLKWTSKFDSWPIDVSHANLDNVEHRNIIWGTQDHAAYIALTSWKTLVSVKKLNREWMISDRNRHFRLSAVNEYFHHTSCPRKHIGVQEQTANAVGTASAGNGWTFFRANHFNNWCSMIVKDQHVLRLRDRGHNNPMCETGLCTCDPIHSPSTRGNDALLQARRRRILLADNQSNILLYISMLPHTRFVGENQVEGWQNQTYLSKYSCILQVRGTESRNAFLPYELETDKHLREILTS